MQVVRYYPNFQKAFDIFKQLALSRGESSGLASPPEFPVRVDATCCARIEGALRSRAVGSSCAAGFDRHWRSQGGRQ
jgi:hypothetical protein